MPVKPLRRNLFQRLLGICATPLPKDDGCWRYETGKAVIDLSRAPELSEPNGAFRLEGKGLPKRLLVLLGEDGQYHAFANACGHGGRRVDPMPGGKSVQCCSMGKSTYDYTGKVIAGASKKPLIPFETKSEGGQVVIAIP